MPIQKKRQVVADLYCLLEPAAKREVDATAGVERGTEKGDALYVQWTHQAATAFLVTCFALMEGRLGKSLWEHHKDTVPADEFQVLWDIRNALVHNGGDVNRKDGEPAPERFKRVRNFGLRLGQEIMWTGGTGGGAVVLPYFTLDGSIVTLNDHAFVRISELVQSLLEAAGIALDSA